MMKGGRGSKLTVIVHAAFDPTSHANNYRQTCIVIFINIQLYCRLLTNITGGRVLSNPIC